MADWRRLKRDTISWWPDGPADKMLIGSWDLIGFTIYWRMGGVRCLCWLFDWHLNFCVSVCVCAHVHMGTCTSLHFYLKGCPTRPALIPQAPCEQTWGGMFMRLACLPLFPHTVSLKKMAHCITPYTGPRQSHSTASSEKGQNKQCKMDAVKFIQLFKTVDLHTSVTVEQRKTITVTYLVRI